MVGLAPPVQDVVCARQETARDQGHRQEEHGEEEAHRVQREPDVFMAGLDPRGAGEHMDRVIRRLLDVL